MRLAVLAVLLSAAAPARAQAAALDDLRLATAVRLALVGDVRTRALDVSVTARGGAVALDGAVPPGDRATVAEVARRVPGVAEVSGLGALGVLPAAGASPEAPPVRAATPVRTATPARDAAARPVPDPDAAAVYHTVAQGETLFSLARRYETTVDDVLRLNGLRDASIRVGQRLRMR